MSTPDDEFTVGSGVVDLFVGAVPLSIVIEGAGGALISFILIVFWFPLDQLFQDPDPRYNNNVKIKSIHSLIFYFQV